MIGPIVVAGLVRELAHEWWRGVPYPGRKRRRDRAMARGSALAAEIIAEQDRRDARRLARREQGRREW